MHFACSLFSSVQTYFITFVQLKVQELKSISVINVIFPTIYIEQMFEGFRTFAVSPCALEFIY